MLVDDDDSWPLRPVLVELDTRDTENPRGDGDGYFKPVQCHPGALITSWE